MHIDSKDYCNNKKCPLHTETETDMLRFSSTYIRVTLDNSEEFTVAIPCLLCSHAEKIDMGHVMQKVATKQMLTRGDVVTNYGGLRDEVIDASIDIDR